MYCTYYMIGDVVDVVDVFACELTVGWWGGGD